MALIAYISAAVKRFGVSSNCDVTATRTEVILTDDTGSRTFVQRHDFDDVIMSYDSIVTTTTFTHSSRVISICSEYSTPTAKTVRTIANSFIQMIFPPNTFTSASISLGLLFDNEVNDFLVPGRVHTQQFDLIDAVSQEDALDILDVGLDRLRRFQKGVFVLHVGEDPFFEWVIVPWCDSFVPSSATLTGLHPNEKLLFILKEFPEYTEDAVERNRQLSSVFQLVADTFSDVPTRWVFHIPTGVTFKSNAALFAIAGSVREAAKYHFGTGRSGLFQRAPRLNEIGGSDSDFAADRSHVRGDDADGQLRAELYGILDIGESDDEHDYIAEARERRRREADARLRAEAEAEARAEQEARARVEAEARARAEADARAAAEARRRADAEAKKRADAEAKKRADAEAKKRADAEAAERARRLKAEQDENEARLRELRAKQQTDQQAALELARLEKLQRDRQLREAERAAEELRRLKHEEEIRKLMEEEDRRLEEEREKRRRLAESAAAREEEARVKAAQLAAEAKARERERQRRLLGLQDDDEDLMDELEEFDERGRRKPTASQLKQKEFVKMQMLVQRARKAAADEDVGIAALTRIANEIRRHLGDGGPKREERKETCRQLAVRLQDKRDRFKLLEEKVKKVRAAFLAGHAKIVDRKWQKAEKKAGAKGEYALTIWLLKQEIKATKADNLALRMRGRTQRIAGNRAQT